jgi:hypothetical protein
MGVDHLMNHPPDKCGPRHSCGFFSTYQSRHGRHFRRNRYLDCRQRLLIDRKSHRHADSWHTVLINRLRKERGCDRRPYAPFVLGRQNLTIACGGFSDAGLGITR